MVEFSEASRNLTFLQFSQKINAFRQKRLTGLLELIQLYQQNPLEKIFIFTIYQNYTLALNHGSNMCHNRSKKQFLSVVMVLAT